MFSSLASFIFGSNTSATTTNSEPIREQQQQLEQQQEQEQRRQQQQQQQQQEQQQHQQQEDENRRARVDAENTINVTSTTPSVTGSTISVRETGLGRSSQVGGKRKANKRNNNNNNRKKGAAAPSLVKLLTPNDSCDEDLNEDEWFIVVKEDEEDSLPRTDSEEELSVVEVKPTVAAPLPIAISNAAAATSRHQQQLQQQQQEQRHRHQHQQLQRQHINSHSLYSGPRPQQQRNLLQRARNSQRPLRNIDSDAANAASIENDCVTQSLYTIRPLHSQQATIPLAATAAICAPNDAAAIVSMEESWFVTPPPCFTSIGPIEMETSPYENLLIEHPSMSVYHSIRSAQEEATESFVNLDLGVGETRKQPRRRQRPSAVSATSVVEAANNNTNGRNLQAAQPQQQQQQQTRSASARAAQLKQELFARSVQKSHDKKERQSLCRGAIARANKVRDFQSKSNRQRRSDMQHCKILSGANNNRKCCF